MIKLPGNSFSQLAKDDPFERIDVEVGDTKQADFFPQVKVMRWDNEVNLSVRLIDGTLGKAAVVEEGGVIKWIKGNTESHFYEHPVSVEHPEGGYEFEVILKTKPTSNRIQFTIQTKGLDFLYQPTLTQKEINEGTSRPENVVGSYAVYHSEKTGDFSPAGGKNYKAGKAFHIYRPKVTDAVGKEIWGELSIDLLSGILGITLNQAFLDTAVYPVTVDPTFGYTTGGASKVVVNFKNLRGVLFTSPTDVSRAESISAYVVSNSTSYLIKGLIVSHNNLNILSNGVGISVSLPTIAAWRTSSFSTLPYLVENTDYVLSIVSSDSTNEVYYDVGNANQGHLDSTNSFATPTNPTDAVHNNHKYSIYCTYLALPFEGKLRGTGTSNPQTLSYTCGTGVKLIVLGIVTAGATIRTGGAPTYNGMTMTQADVNRSATETCAELWYLLNPPTGAAYNISAPNTGVKTVYLLASSYIPPSGYEYVYDTANGNVATSADPDVAVTTTVNNDVVVAVLGDGLDTAPTAQSHISLFSVDDGTYSDNLQYAVQATAGAITLSWTVASDDWAMCVGAWKEVAASSSNVGFFQLF